MKKSISIILCFCLIATLFISCKKDNSEKTADINYTYDSAYSFDDATIRAYKDLCKAVVNGENELRMNSGLLDNVLQLFYTSFPLSVTVKNIEPNESVFRIIYKNEEKHSQEVEDFINKVNEYKTGV